MAEAGFAWFAGIDCGSERHQACFVDVQGSIVAEREFAHNSTGLAELGDWLLSIAGPLPSAGQMAPKMGGPAIV
jgi:hypothetical protein